MKGVPWPFSGRYGVSLSKVLATSLFCWLALGEGGSHLLSLAVFSQPYMESGTRFRELGQLRKVAALHGYRTGGALSSLTTRLFAPCDDYTTDVAGIPSPQTCGCTVHCRSLSSLHLPHHDDSNFITSLWIFMTPRVRNWSMQWNVLEIIRVQQSWN